MAKDVAELDPEFLWNGMVMFTHHALSPWLSLVDRDRFARAVDRIQDHQPTTIASGHSPAITGASVDQVLALTRRLPDAEPPPAPDQVALDHILAASGDNPGPIPARE